MPTDKRQRQKENRSQRREKERKRAIRRTALRRTRRYFTILVVLLGVYLVAVYLQDRPDALPGAYRQIRDRPTACGAQQPGPFEPKQFEQPSDQGIPQGAAVTARLRTSCGEVVVELGPAGAPATVNSFVFLARQGYFDGMVFHRVLDEFLVETGDPDADGSGGPGYRLPDEYPGERFAFEEGVVVMDNDGPGTTGSRFFIVAGEGGGTLARAFNVLGRVVEGLDTVQEIAALPVTPNPLGQLSLPLEAAYLESVEIACTPGC
ncbi:MAG: peptidylprolyl isomerase [Acidimicrobiia bacterium]